MKTLLVTLTLIGLAVASAASGQAVSRVRSSLDGKLTLPYRIPWTAYPSAPSSRIKEVDFLVDGKVRWIEQHAPYSYADGDGFVTTWLSAGTHRFTVRAVETNGARSSDTVAATVHAPPAPPAELAGSWHRTVDTSSLHNPPGIENPSGTYALTFDPRWIRAHFPAVSCRAPGRTRASTTDMAGSSTPTASSADKRSRSRAPSTPTSSTTPISRAASGAGRTTVPSTAGPSTATRSPSTRSAPTAAPAGS